MRRNGTMADPDLAEQTVSALWGVALSIGAAAVVIVLVGWLVLHASKRPFPSSVVTSLTILAALALIGYAVGGESRPELAAIAGTAVGALAGATTSLLAGRKEEESWRELPGEE